MLVQFDQTDYVGWHAPRHQRLTDHDVTVNGSPAADRLEMHRASGEPAALKWWVDPLAGVVAPAQHQLAVLETFPVRRGVWVGNRDRRL
ncbi:hypothetical protein MOKP125_34190 [Mycobacterium avium subsp. hominissuis]